MDILNILNRLNACHSPSGEEGAAAAVIRALAAPYVDEITTDTLGSLICHKKGPDKKIMFAAHMDSIGFVVTHIDEGGFLRFGAVGGLAAHEVLGAPVRFANGVRGVVALEGKAEAKDMKLDNLYIDVGAKDRAEAGTMVRVGDTAVYDTAAFTSGSRVFSPYLDDRIACAALLLAMERLGETDNDLYFVFTAQEERAGGKGGGHQADGLLRHLPPRRGEEAGGAGGGGGHPRPAGGAEGRRHRRRRHPPEPGRGVHRRHLHPHPLYPHAPGDG